MMCLYLLEPEHVCDVNTFFFLGVSVVYLGLSFLFQHSSTEFMMKIFSWCERCLFRSFIFVSTFKYEIHDENFFLDVSVVYLGLSFLLQH